MKPLIGLIVIYQFDEAMAELINRRIDGTLGQSWERGIPEPIPLVAHGMLCAAVITNVHGDGNDEVNLKLFLDAPFDIWIQGIRKWNGVPGQGVNKWRWPLESQKGEQKR